MRYYSHCHVQNSILPIVVCSKKKKNITFLFLFLQEILLQNIHEKCHVIITGKAQQEIVFV